MVETFYHFGTYSKQVPKILSASLARASTERKTLMAWGHTTGRFDKAYFLHVPTNIEPPAHKKIAARTQVSVCSSFVGCLAKGR